MSKVEKLRRLEAEAIEIFEVGGCVRDQILGRKSNDVDFSVVAPSFEAMREFVESEGLTIVVETPEFGTIRAVAKQPWRGHRGGLDFVWARKDGPYTDGRRPDWTRPGTLMDDLSRRDFTMNAIARDTVTGELIDPFGGMQDIDNAVIRAVGDPYWRFVEDGLRVMRAIRFSITLGFDIEHATWSEFHHKRVVDALSKVSVERIQIELEKAFQHDTLATMEFLSHRLSPEILDAIFRDGLRLSATLKS